MTNDDTNPSRFDGIKGDLLQPTIRLVIALVVLGALLAVLTRVPGVDRVVADPDITVAILLFSVIVLVMFGAILNYATVVGETLAEVFPNFPEIERIVQLAALFGIVVIAHQLFWWAPYFRDNPGQYDLLFLILGLGVGGWLGYLVYTNVDDISAVFTRQVLRSRLTNKAVQSPDGGGIISRINKLNPEDRSRSNQSSGSTKFVSEAQREEPMTRSEEEEAVEIETTSLDECFECGTTLPENVQFCHECGAEQVDSSR